MNTRLFLTLGIFLASAPLMASSAFANQKFSIKQRESQPVQYVPTLNKLKAQDIVLKDCYYGGKRYSEGSVIKGADGVLVQCVGDKWVLK